jgi:hypothetical protein
MPLNLGPNQARFHSGGPGRSCGIAQPPDSAWWKAWLASKHVTLALVAAKHPRRQSRYALRWLRRLLEEHDGLTLSRDRPREGSVPLGPAVAAAVGTRLRQVPTELSCIEHQLAERLRE